MMSGIVLPFRCAMFLHGHAMSTSLSASSSTTSALDGSLSKSLETPVLLLEVEQYSALRSSAWKATASAARMLACCGLSFRRHRSMARRRAWPATPRLNFLGVSPTRRRRPFSMAGNLASLRPPHSFTPHSAAALLASGPGCTQTACTGAPRRAWLPEAHWGRVVSGRAGRGHGRILSTPVRPLCFRRTGRRPMLLAWPGGAARRRASRVCAVRCARCCAGPMAI
eukprot:7391903-Prymnesium_polylepis.3